MRPLTESEKALHILSCALVSDPGNSRIKMTTDGRYLVMGDIHANGGVGCAYVFEMGNSSIELSAMFQTNRYICTLYPDDKKSKLWFGHSVAISNDGMTIAVGQCLGTGIHIFTRVEDVCTKQIILTPGDESGSWSFCFGFKLSADGKTVRVNAQSTKSPTTHPIREKEFVFFRTGDTWTRQS